MPFKASIAAAPVSPEVATIILILSCSFDNKSGIWDGSQQDKLSKNDQDYLKKEKNIQRYISNTKTMK